MEKKNKLNLTHFQKEVLKIVLKIPLGQTRSYSWIARKLGKPEAIRAIGRTLKKNPLPFIIPCHRVIRKDGSTGEYFLGKRFKKKLLDLEKIIFK